ncbi:MAG: EamA family transporter, partial [Egibacteraceae bacterium]
GYSLFASGLSLLAAATVATLTLVEPLAAALLAVVVLGERPGAVAVLGAGLVATGLVLLAVRPAASRATAAL